jgi:23S rRNA pseudouridine1911/1915/1917 synthase
VNRGYEYRDRIGRDASGLPVLAYLADRYRHSSEADWSERIASGEIRIDGLTVSPETKLASGQVVSWHRPPWREPDAPLDYAVLRMDGPLLAVAKPAGLPTVPGGGYLEHTLLHLVRRRVPEAVPMHRLGRWTSGIVLFGCTPEARARVAADWREGRVRRTYRGLARGSPARDRFEIEVPIGPVPHPVLGSVNAASEDGRFARTSVEVAERRDGCFLADIVIATGRPHQIRIHLAAAGHPLVGDPLYATGGRPAAGCTALPGDPGYLLHAVEIRLPHPTRSTETTLSCPVPRVLRR